MVKFLIFSIGILIGMLLSCVCCICMEDVLDLSAKNYIQKAEIIKLQHIINDLTKENEKLKK